MEISSTQLLFLSHNMKATPWPEGCARAPLLKAEQSSGLSSSLYSTIHDVPTTSLANQTELALILLMDRSKRQILLQVPGTKLNWRYHFGCQIVLEDGEIDPAKIATVLQSHSIQGQPSDIRKAGTMLFSFPVQDPMRVHVLEATVDASQATTELVGGTWTSLDDIPYSDMWADDVLWLPWFTESDSVSFEGHFIFGGGPGPTSQLVAHNCQRTDR